MTVEKATLLSENEKLQSQLSGNLNDPESIHMSLRVQEENKREIEQLRERNYELEAIVDDFKVKNQVKYIKLKRCFEKQQFLFIMWWFKNV